MVTFLAAVRVFMSVLIALAPIPMSGLAPGTDDSSPSRGIRVAFVSAADAAGPVLAPPDGGAAHGDDGEEEALLDADDHSMSAERRHGLQLQASYEQALHYPTFRPPKRTLA
jgi:hypothetical protein